MFYYILLTKIKKKYIFFFFQFPFFLKKSGNNIENFILKMNFRLRAFFS